MIKTMIFTHLLRSYAMEKMKTVMKPLRKMPSIETTGTSTQMKMVLETVPSIPELFFCANPEGYVSNGDDCDDSLETGMFIYPNSTELCDDVDNDCDGDIDEQGGPDTPIWHLDDDSDGYGDFADPHMLHVMFQMDMLNITMTVMIALHLFPQC